MSANKSVTATFNLCYPTTYTNGPLGTSNPLPACGKGFLIDYYGGFNVTWAQTQTGVLQRESDIGRNFNGIGIHYGGGGPGPLGDLTNCAYITPSEQRELWIHNQGAIPVVSWSPNATLADINAGSEDACFNEMADYFKQFQFPIMLRLMWEMDDTGPIWHATTGTDYVQAWQRIVNLFKARGATKVGFYWCPTHGVNRTLADASYPGDTYVDWVGADGYNHNSGGWDSPLHSGWAELWEILGYPPTGGNTSVHDVWGPHKPYIIGETGTVYDSGTPTRKANWFRNIPTLAVSHMPYLRGVEFFDQDLAGDVSEKWDWRVDNNQTYDQRQAGIDGTFDATTYQGFLDMAASSFFAG